MKSTRRALRSRCLLCVVCAGALGSLAGCGTSGVEPLSADTIAAVERLEQPRPTDAEKLAHLLFYFQGIDKLRKSGYRDSLKLDEAQTEAVLALADAVDQLNSKAQSATDETADAFDQQYDDLAKRLGAELRQTLTREQFDPLRVELLEAQIGATAFLMPGVPETLQLTDRQIAQISTMIEAHKDELKPRNFSLWNIRKVIALGRKLRANAEQLLDEQQTQRWGEITSGELAIAD